MSLSRQAKKIASYRAVPPPGRRSRIAFVTATVSSVRSATSSGDVSKLTTSALSLPGRITVVMKSVAASWMNWNRSRMLLLVSIRIASRKGRSVSAVNSRICCGFLFSIISKSSLVRSLTKRPFLSVTVYSRFTRVTSTVIRLWSSAEGAALGAAFCLAFCPNTRATLTKADNRTFHKLT